VSYETVRRWALKFGAIIARKLRRGRSRPDVRWHLDEVFVSINGRQADAPALISRSGYADMAPRDSRSVNRRGNGHLACKFPINVTVSSPNCRRPGVARLADAQLRMNFMAEIGSPDRVGYAHSCFSLRLRRDVPTPGGYG
jgi:hypothetical protein